MRQSTIFLSTATVLVLSAGLVVGRLSAQLPAVKPSQDHGRGWFHDQLNLTTDQKQKMDGVWADVKQQMDKVGDRRRGLDKERDSAIRALLTPGQLAAYDKIFQDYHTQRAELDKQREQLMKSANERSRALLSPEQQVKWDAMAKDMHDHDRHGPAGPGGPGGRDGHGRGDPATQSGGPASGPS